eukprot:m.43208 g.43208  ORF g.43208 m.43208 type:complete len:526 (-) comp19319_c0_seq1:190-1767(-)
MPLTRSASMRSQTQSLYGSPTSIMGDDTMHLDKDLHADQEQLDFDKENQSEDNLMEIATPRRFSLASSIFKKKFSASAPRPRMIKSSASKRTSMRRTPSSSSIDMKRSRSTSKKKQHRRLQGQMKSFFESPVKMQHAVEWSKQVSPSVLKLMEQHEKKKQEAIFETTNGEDNYVQNMDHVLRVYGHTMLQQHHITEMEHASIFANLEGIVKQHKKLNEMFIKARTPTGISNIGTILLNWLSSWDAADSYGSYCSNIAYAKHVLRGVIQRHDEDKNPTFSQFMHQAKQCPRSRRQTLEDLLDFPRRRLQNYGLLIAAIQKYSTNGVEEAEKISAALKSVTEICVDVDNQVAMKGRAKIISIQESIDFSHAASWQQINLVDENVPLLLEAEAQLKDGKTCRVYLFQHKLLITKESKHDCSKMQIVGRPIQITHLEATNAPVLGSSFKGKKVDKAEAECILNVSNCDPQLQKNSTTRRKQASKIQRAASNTGKSHQIRFSSKNDRDVWKKAIDDVKRDAVAESVVSFV